MGERTAKPDLAALVREVMLWHRDPNAGDLYNYCDKEPCAWCTAATNALRAADRAGERRISLSETAGT
jgi:hypothetical protein